VENRQEIRTNIEGNTHLFKIFFPYFPDLCNPKCKGGVIAFIFM